VNLYLNDRWQKESAGGFWLDCNGMDRRDFGAEAGFGKFGMAGALREDRQ